MDVATAYVMLGLERTASYEEARATYRARAQLLHPDRANEAARAEAERAMSQLNVAWDVVLADLRERHFQAPPEPTDAARPPVDGECDLCGWGPARPITLRRTTGLIIVWRWARTRNTLCRRCGNAWYAENQAYSLVRGWWGIVAPVANVINMFRNRVAIGAHRRRLGEPTDRPPGVVTLFSSPMPWRSPWRRPSSILATLAASLVLGVLVAAWVDSTNGHPGSSTNVQIPSPPRGIGGCVDSVGRAVWCGSPNAYWRLETTAASTQDCADAGYEESMTDEMSGQIYCASRLK
jgi:hypothetical protein